MAKDKVLNATRAMYFIFLVLNILSTGNCNGQVPLMMWSSDRNPLQLFTPPTAGHIMSSGQLVSYLNSALSSGPHNILLFLQDKLSMEDFTKYGGVFGNKEDSAFPNLETALQDSSSPLVLPALSWSDSRTVPELLQAELGTPPLFVEPATLTQLHLNASESTLLVISLPYCTGTYIPCKEVLLSNDEVVGEVLNIMKAQDVSYSAIFTGRSPSQIIQKPSSIGQSMGRHLLQEPGSGLSPPLIFNNSENRPCIMLWAQNLNISIFRSPDWKSLDLGPQTFGVQVNMDGSFCNRTNSRLVLNYVGPVLDFQSFRLIFSMSQRFYSVSARNWFSLDNVLLEYDNSTATFNGSRGIYAPAEYSFHCQGVSSFLDPLLLPRNNTDNANLWRLFFNDFQIQGFGVTGADFSYASDCASFFTAGIWMGLLTSLLMLLVLTYGLHMIMQLNTMDRFDDPKGPTISVPQND